MTSRATDSSEAAPLGRSLAIAYKANPLVQWMFAEDLSQERLGGLFTSLVEFGLQHGLVYRSSNCDGAAIWFPPIGGDRTGESNLEVAADTAEWSSGRRGDALAVLAAARPAERHFYLDAVGVVPQGRHRGTASDLLKPVLVDCDNDGIGAYLENSDPANANFYARHGFEEVAPLSMPQGAPVVVSMWRKPRPAP